MPRRERDPGLREYALVGDGRTAALVCADGSVDWLCHGRFDGPAVFWRLLDGRRGGYFQVAPAVAFRASRRYLWDINVLDTEFECAGGRVRLTDCMPSAAGSPSSLLLRRLEGLAGEVRVRLDFAPAFDFGRAATRLERLPEGLLARSAAGELALSAPRPLELSGEGAWAEWTLRAGESCWLALAQGTAAVDAGRCEALLAATLAAEERWAARGSFPEPYAAAVRRSALLLKLLIHAPTGAMVAAPTTSLPEARAGARNWDYRFAWLRDSSWLVSALMQLGYHEESMAFIDWLERLDLARGRPSVFYDLDGRPPRHEQILAGVAGHRGAAPVRLGNAASDQDQHDVFGEVVSAIFLCSEGMPSMRPLRPGLWRMVTALADQAALHWPHADRGLWEVRDAPRHFLSSKLLCWSALEQALAIGRRDRLPGPTRRWEAERERIRLAILEDGYSPALGAFRRALGEDALDASALLIPRLGLLPADDPRVVATVRAVRARLSAGDGLLRRYLADDGLPGTEGTFLACSFWLADCLARGGRVEEARRVFERVLAQANDVGLLAEEVDPETGELLGNFPQAFTHLALIRAAVSIAQAPRGVHRLNEGAPGSAPEEGRR